MTDAERLQDIDYRTQPLLVGGYGTQDRLDLRWLLNYVRSLEGLLGDVLEAEGLGRLEVVRRAVGIEAAKLGCWMCEKEMPLKPDDWRYHQREYQGAGYEWVQCHAIAIRRHFGLDAKEQQKQNASGTTGCGICRDPNCREPNGKH